MESVPEKIRQGREEQSKRKADLNVTEMVVNGCNVKIRFDKIGDNKIMSDIKAMLIASHLDSVIGGESA